MDLRCLAIAACILVGCGASADARYENGRLLLKQGKLPEAMREADWGLRTEASWRFRILKADILILRSDVAGAKALLAFQQPPTDAESLARWCADEAWLEQLASHYAPAEALLQQAAENAKPLQQPLLDAMIENRLGFVEVREGRREEAEINFRHVIEIAAAQHDSGMEAGAMGNLGVMFLNDFQLEEAIFWLDKARLRFKELGRTDFYYITLANLASCYQRLGDFDQALQNYQEAEAHAREAGDTYSQQHWTGNSGEVLSDRGDLRAASEKFQQALALAKSRDQNESDLTGWWYYNLASLAIELGDFDKAELYNREALKRRLVAANHSDFYPRVNEAHIAAGRRDPGAEALYRGLIAESHKDPEQMLEAVAGLAELLAQTGKFEQADAEFRGALEQLESQRIALDKPDHRMTYLAKLISFYDRYITFLVDRKQPERALEVAESSRARVLDERLESKSTHTAVRAAQIREMARSSNSVFLSYWLGKKRSYLWAVTADGVTLHELPPENQITPLVSGYRSFIENLRDPLQSEHPAGRQLSKVLLAPVASLLGSDKRVVLVPDRSLHSINFETLPDPENPSKYLIERTTVEVAPSLNLLVAHRAPQRTSDALLVVGDAEQVVEEYPRLPYAGAEIEQISKAVAPASPTVIQGAKAFPAAYRDAQPGRYAWIHFAVHAAANQGSPLDSALILSRGPQSTAYQLSAREVMNVPLNATLVTLSACRSAGAKTYSGEGQVGLSWAFLRAGARSVVAGLWDVTDRSTAALMADFYDQLAHRASPADALRHGKLMLLHGGRAYQKPFYWGPFQLYAGAI